MDYLKLSSSLGHLAQGLVAHQRNIESLLGKGRVPKVVVDRAMLRRIAENLRQAAEVADRASILLDAEVDVPVKA